MLPLITALLFGMHGQGDCGGRRGADRAVACWGALSPRAVAAGAHGDGIVSKELIFAEDGRNPFVVEIKTGVSHTGSSPGAIAAASGCGFLRAHWTQRQRRDRLDRSQWPGPRCSDRASGRLSHACPAGTGARGLHPSFRSGRRRGSHRSRISFVGQGLQGAAGAQGGRSSTAGDCATTRNQDLTEGPNTLAGKRVVRTKGYSPLELERAGLTAEDAHRFGLAVERDRKTMVASNVMQLRRLKPA